MNRKLWENLFALLFVQALNYLAPLLTLPLLTRVLGPGTWGKLAFAEAYANYLSLVIEYGFGLSATREVARSSSDKKMHSELLTGVLTAQALLAGIVTLATVILAALVPSLRDYIAFLLFAVPLAIFRAMTPLWYFQGLERMRLVAALNIAVNLFSAGVVLVVVHSPSQALIPIAVRAAGAFVAVLIALSLAYRDLRFTRPSFAQACTALRSGWSVFLFKSAVSLYTTCNVLLIGLLAPAAAVAWFAGAERIFKAATSVFSPLSQAFYPRISNLLTNDLSQAKNVARTSTLLTVGCGILIGLVMFAGAPILVKVLLGSHYEASVPVLRCLALLPPVIGASTVLGVQWMLPLRLESTYTCIILSAGVLNVLLAVALTPKFHEMGVAYSVTAAEILVSLTVIKLLHTKRLAPWSKEKRELAAEATCSAA